MAIKVPDGAYNDKLLKIMMSLHQYDMVFFRKWLGVLNSYPSLTHYPVFFLCQTQFSFENRRVAGNPKYGVLPDISGKPKVLGMI